MNNIYGEYGFVHGSFVYMVLCEDSGKAHIKVGLSDHPLRRLDEIRVGCPFKPLALYTMKRPSRKSALRLERTIHRGLKKWASHGEWFSVVLEEKPAFNEALRQAVMLRYVKGYPVEWTRLNIRSILAEKASRRAFFYQVIAKRGRAFKDFCADSHR